MWICYEFLLFLAFLCYLPKALWRKRLPHPGWGMRLGRYPQDIRAQLAGSPAIWIHAVSVGEVIAARPLLAEFSSAKPDHALVVSTVTPAGFAAATRLFGNSAAVIYGPLDFRAVVGRALEAIRPQMIVLVESELWPVFIDHATRRRIPVAVVNGRVSARAFRRYQWVKLLLRPMLRQVRAYLMQTEQDAQRVIDMGAPADRVQVVGSLKWDAAVLMRPSAQTCEELGSRLGVQSGAPILVAGSTHRGEEDAVLNALQALRGQGISARLILAPRHLERLAEVEALITGRGLIVQRTSAIPPPTDVPEAHTRPSGPTAGGGTIRAPSQQWDVALIDAIGTLPAYYGLATVAFIGGSVIPHGGQNPLEPASVGKPVIFGPFMHNFSEIAQRLLEGGGAAQVRNASELVEIIRRLFEQPSQTQTMGQRAQAAVAQHAGVSRRTLQLLQPLFPTPAA